VETDLKTSFYCFISTILGNLETRINGRITENIFDVFRNREKYSLEGVYVERNKTRDCRSGDICPFAAHILTSGQGLDRD